MSYEQDKHKVRKIFEQTGDIEQELTKINIPVPKTQNNQLLRKIKPLVSQTTNITPLFIPPITVPSNLHPVASPNMADQTDPNRQTNMSKVALQNFAGIGIGYTSTGTGSSPFMHVQVAGILDKVYRLTSIPAYAYQDRFEDEFHQGWQIGYTPGAALTSADKALFTAGNTYTVRARYVDATTGRCLLWSEWKTFEIYSFFPLPSPPPLYGGLISAPGGSDLLYQFSSEYSKGYKITLNGVDITDEDGDLANAPLFRSIRVGTAFKPVTMKYDRPQERWYFEIDHSPQFLGASFAVFVANDPLTGPPVGMIHMNATGSISISINFSSGFAWIAHDTFSFYPELLQHVPHSGNGETYNVHEYWMHNDTQTNWFSGEIYPPITDFTLYTTIYSAAFPVPYPQEGMIGFTL